MALKKSGSDYFYDVRQYVPDQKKFVDIHTQLTPNWAEAYEPKRPSYKLGMHADAIQWLKTLAIICSNPEAKDKFDDTIEEHAKAIEEFRKSQPKPEVSIDDASSGGGTRVD
jgi:hypothetical protein